MDDPQQRFTIQEISEKLNIPKPTLRFWEKELGRFLVPSRTPGGQRRYTVENFHIIQEINKLRKEGMSIAEIERELNSGYKAKVNNLSSDHIDLLADRIAEIVKKELREFLYSEENLNG
ncbi:MAG: MerR family transcriptional regulator [Desulfobacterales bacterium]|jgi:DNA-binding transcriptional MerR regulator